MRYGAEGEKESKTMSHLFASMINLFFIYNMTDEVDRCNPDCVPFTKL